MWTNAKSQICWSTQEEEVLFYSSSKSNISKMSDKSELSKFPKDEENSFKLSAFTPTKKLSINHSNSKAARINFIFCIWSNLKSSLLWLMKASLNTFFILLRISTIINSTKFDKKMCHKDKEETICLNSLTLKTQSTFFQS